MPGTSEFFRLQFMRQLPPNGGLKGVQRGPWGAGLKSGCKPFAMKCRGGATKWSALAAPSTPLDSSKRQTTRDDGNESVLFLWSNRSFPLFPLDFSPVRHVIYSFSSSVPVNVLFEYYYFYSLTSHNAGKLHKKRHKGEWNNLIFSPRHQSFPS